MKKQGNANYYNPIIPFVTYVLGQVESILTQFRQIYVIRVSKVRKKRKHHELFSHLISILLTSFIYIHRR